MFWRKKKPRQSTGTSPSPPLDRSRWFPDPKNPEAVRKHPIHIRLRKIMARRSFDGLEGISTKNAALISEILCEGILLGKDSRKIGRELIAQVEGIGKERAHLLAGTEIKRTFNIARIEEGERLGADLGFKPRYKWAVTGCECPGHQERRNKTYTRQEILSHIGEPHCKCAIFVANDMIEEMERGLSEEEKNEISEEVERVLSEEEEEE